MIAFAERIDITGLVEPSVWAWEPVRSEGALSSSSVPARGGPLRPASAATARTALPSVGSGTRAVQELQAKALGCP